MERSIIRREYLDKLSAFKGMTDIVKVVTGIRRCGKSTLLNQYTDMLRAEGVSDADIIFLNLDYLSTKPLWDCDSLYSYLMEKTAGRRTYVFLDEIQNVEGWELAVNSVRGESDADIYITGSNAHMLSSKLATMLTGRLYVMNMLPLSFKEFLELNPCGNDRASLEARYGDYVRMGSLPSIRVELGAGLANELTLGILDTILGRDVSPRNEIRDRSTLNALTSFVLDNCGNITNASNIAKELGVNRNTIDSYLSLIEEAYLVYRVEKYDYHGKKILKSDAKYYCTDIGMRAALVGYGNNDKGRVLENVVFLELLRRGYSIRIGSIKGREIDFTARKGGAVEYYQVAWSVGEWNEEREYGNLRLIDDNYPKTVITADSSCGDGVKGIRTVNYLDFLLER